MSQRSVSIIKAFVNAYKPIRKVNFLYEAVRAVVWLYARVMLRMDIVRHAPLPKGPKIFTANHPSFNDPFLIHLHSKMSVMITHKAFAFPPFGFVLRKIGQISVSPGGDSLQQAIRRLQEEKSVGIFPEGAFSPLEGGFGKAHSGAARLALSTGASVIPIGIHLKRERMLRTNARGLPKVGFVYVRGPYAVTIGEAMRFEGDVEDRALVNKVSEVIMDKIKLLALESEDRMLMKGRPMQIIADAIKKLVMLNHLGLN
jgi:1-acyl-sn-glycerol-3-phosphate acyltransferase